MATTELPRWDVTPFYPSLESREFSAAHESIGAGVARLQALYDNHDVRAPADDSRLTVDDAAVAAVEEVVAATNELLDDVRLVNGYVSTFVTTDARNDLAASLASSLRAAVAPLGPLAGRFDAWIAAFGVDELAAASPVAADHAHAMRQSALAARHLMGEPEEDLAAELNLSGGSAWTQLHGEVSSRLLGTVVYPDGPTEDLPITAVRNLAFDPHAEVRRAAFDAELAAWESVSVTIAACMNGVKGQANVLNRRRGWEDAIAPALHSNAVDRRTLDAMQAAVVASFPDFRRYLAAKARVLGHHDGVLPWWDLFAPVGDPATSATTWEEAQAIVADAFGSFSGQLRALAERAYADGWIDVAPRDGKRGGAFCMPVRGDESRVFLNFGATIDSVSTLAHELGHAYHNTQLAERTAMQRRTPMALAETASIFCETVLIQSALTDADDAQRLVLLETDLQGACQVVVDIHSRFLFEKEVFEKRAARALSVAEFKDLMTWAQGETYGDVVDPDHRHPYMWAVKPHYYGTSFYNWPYTFGLLFGIGLYAQYLQDPERFRSGYDDLLSATGLGTAAELAGRFGIDVADEGFWTASLDVLRHRIDDFDALAARLQSTEAG